MNPGELVGMGLCVLSRRLPLVGVEKRDRVVVASAAPPLIRENGPPVSLRVSGGDPGITTLRSASKAIHKNPRRAGRRQRGLESFTVMRSFLFFQVSLKRSDLPAL